MSLRDSNASHTGPGNCQSGDECLHASLLNYDDEMVNIREKHALYICSLLRYGTSTLCDWLEGTWQIKKGENAFGLTDLFTKV